MTRREALATGVVTLGASCTGCIGSQSPESVLTEGFESESDGWTADTSIGPEVDVSEFQWRVERSRERAADGEWSLSVFTEGDHDDGTAWAVTEAPPPDAADSFEASIRAWSPSESFNTLRHLVAYLGPERPTDEGSFPEPGVNSSAFDRSPTGGLREPLHLAEGWREYTFDWRPAEAPDELYFAVGVSVVWEADATHYVDSVDVTAE